MPREYKHIKEYKKEKVTAELQLHSDPGFQYISQAYFKLTKSYGITPSISDAQSHTIMHWQKIFSQFSKQSAFTEPD